MFKAGESVANAGGDGEDDEEEDLGLGGMCAGPCVARLCIADFALAAECGLGYCSAVRSCSCPKRLFPM